MAARSGAAPPRSPGLGAKSSSLPSLGGTSRSFRPGASGSSFRPASTSSSRAGEHGAFVSPYEEARLLCTVSVSSNSLRREAVQAGRVKPLYQGRLPWVLREAGPKERRGQPAIVGAALPPLEEILGSFFGELGLQLPGPEEKEARRAAAEARFKPYRGPRLPLQPRARLEDKPQFGSDGFDEGSFDSLSAGEAQASGDRRRSSISGMMRGVGMMRRRSSVVKSAAVMRRMSVAAAAAAAEEDPGDNLPWAADEMRSVFSQFDTDRDGEVHVEEANSMLRKLGCRPGMGDAQRLIEQQTQYSTLNYDEFVEFVRRYRELDVGRLREQFEHADVNKNGTISFAELHALLHRLGYTPTTQATLEALDRLDTNDDQSLTFEEFLGLREHLRQTEGLTRAECEELRELYAKVDLQTSDFHQIKKECWRVSNFLGYPIKENEFGHLLGDYDISAGAGVSFSELLKAIRRVRQKERESLKGLIAKVGVDTKSSRALPNEDLGIVCSEFGYVVSEEVIFECLDKLDEVEEEDTLTLDELALFLRQYRKVEGFTSAEIADFERVFKEHLQESGKGFEALDTLATGRVLRHFGVATTLQQVQQLLEELDFDGSGRLEFNEFLKMMRRLYQEEAARVRALFDQMDRGSGFIPVQQLPEAVDKFEGAQGDPDLIDKALEMAGVKDSRGKRPTPKRVKSGDAQGRPPGTPLDDPMLGTASSSSPGGSGKRPRTPRGYISRTGFQEFFRVWRKIAVDQVRQRAGYSTLEVSRLQEAFTKLDKDGGGTIDKTEFRELILIYFPDATKSREAQKEVMKVLESVDDDGSQELDFQEFLHLLRRCDDMRDAADIALEREVVAECGFTAEETDGFRQVFAAHVDWTGELGVVTIADLLSKVIDFSEVSVEKLQQLVQDVHPHGRDVARFPQFLRLIKRLTTENYGSVNSRAAQKVAAEQSQNRVLRSRNSRESLQG